MSARILDKPRSIHSIAVCFTNTKVKVINLGIILPAEVGSDGIPRLEYFGARPDYLAECEFCIDAETPLHELGLVDLKERNCFLIVHGLALAFVSRIRERG